MKLSSVSFEKFYSRVQGFKSFLKSRLSLNFEFKNLSYIPRCVLDGSRGWRRRNERDEGRVTVGTTENSVNDEEKSPYKEAGLWSLHTYRTRE